MGQRLSAGARHRRRPAALRLDNGSRLDLDRGVSSLGPWLLSIDHSGVIGEIGALSASLIAGPGPATFVFANLAQLDAAASAATDPGRLVEKWRRSPRNRTAQDSYA
jgi:hypothetical protein